MSILRHRRDLDRTATSTKSLPRRQPQDPCTLGTIGTAPTSAMPEPASLHDHQARQRERLQRAVQHAWPNAGPDDRDQLRTILNAVEDGTLKPADAHRVVAHYQRRQQQQAA